MHSVTMPARDFHGAMLDSAPDLIVGYYPGYRGSWQTALGATPGTLVDDNTEAWRGDHCIDAVFVPGVLLANRKVRAEAPRLEDITVTALQKFGVDSARGDDRPIGILNRAAAGTSPGLHSVRETVRLEGIARTGKRMKPRIALCMVAFCSSLMPGGAENLGLFDAQGDVGETPQKGSAEVSGGEYRITGGGANIWANADAFHYVWKKMSGDFTLTADVHFLGSGAVAHRKVVLMIRQSLDPGSAYADAALHGDGLTSLQFRPAAGGLTQELKQEAKSDLAGPVRLRIERRGDSFTMLAGKPGEQFTSTGPTTVSLRDPVYAGLGVCSHHASVLETAVFSNVAMKRP